MKFEKEILVKDVTLVNNLGQTVLPKIYNNKFSSLTIGTKNNRSGYYTVKINTVQGRINKKIYIKSN